MRSTLLIRAVTSTKYITNDHHGRDVHEHHHDEAEQAQHIVILGLRRVAMSFTGARSASTFAGSQSSAGRLRLSSARTWPPLSGGRLLIVPALEESVHHRS